MTGGRHLDRRPVLVVAVVAALVAVSGVAAVVVDHVAHGSSGVPRVAQLPGPTTPVTATPTPTSTLDWKPCSKGECATLAVPVDWTGTDPAARGMTVPLALFRVRATGPASQRLGALVVDPGGPGGSGVDFVRDGLSRFPAEVRQRFDIVGFDPRGAGASDGVHCETGPQLDAFYAEPPYPTGARQQQQLVAAAQREADACATALGPLLRHLSTVDAARDLDAIRAALGEQRLTYLGYSYGTYLGATYAQLFPDRIRAFVLDGAIDPTLTGTELISGQADGFEQAFDAFAAWCGGSSSCPFGQHLAGASQVEQAYATLAAQVARAPLPAARPVTSGLFLEGTLVTLYDRTDGWPALGVALSRAQADDGSVLLQLSDEFLGRHADGSYDPEGEANSAVNCLDHTYPTVAQAATLADRLAARDPLFGRAIAWSGLTCAVWRAPAHETTTPITAPGSPPILVVGTTRDPATPYVEAQALARQLSDGRLLTYDGDGHTAYRAGGSACVVAAVDAYLVDLRAPDRATGARC